MESSQTIPSQGRLVGIDYGSVRIGVAICDPSQRFVNPVETYTRRNEKLDSQYFRELAATQRLVGWVIGLPINCDGTESQKSKEVREFAVWLSKVTGLPSALYDERFSSREARQLMLETGWGPKKKKKNVDRLAAHIILTHFLDSRGAESSGSL